MSALTSVELVPAGALVQRRQAVHKPFITRIWALDFEPCWLAVAEQRGWTVPFSLPLDEQSSANQVFHREYSCLHINGGWNCWDAMIYSIGASSSTSASMFHLQPCRTNGTKWDFYISISTAANEPCPFQEHSAQCHTGSLNPPPGSPVQLTAFDIHGKWKKTTEGLLFNFMGNFESGFCLVLHFIYSFTDWPKPHMNNWMSSVYHSSDSQSPWYLSACSFQ